MCTCGKWKVSNKDFFKKGVANRKTVCYDKYIEKGMKKNMITVNGHKLRVVTFPNGERTIAVPKETKMYNTATVYWKYENDGEFVLLNQLADVLQNLGVENVACLVAYMPYSRMDRRMGEHPFSLAVVGAMLPRTSWSYSVLEPHSDATLRALPEYASPHYVTVDLVNDFIKESSNSKRVVVFPDKGARERYKGKLDMGTDGDSWMFYGEKQRDEQGNIISLALFESKTDSKVTVEDPDFLRGYDVIIADDLTSYGGTFIRCAKILKELGAKDITLVVTHAEKSVLDGDLFEHIEHLVTTDSIISQEDVDASPYKDRITVNPIITGGNS